MSHNFHTVNDLMSKQVITVAPNDTIDKIFTMMAESPNKIRTFPVVDSKSLKLVGIISDRDIRVCVGAPQLDHKTPEETLKRLAHLKVSEIMTKNVLTVADNTSIEDAAKFMRVAKLDSLPVVNESTNKLIGIVTRSDMLDCLIRILEPTPKSSTPNPFLQNATAMRSTQTQ